MGCCSCLLPVAISSARIVQEAHKDVVAEVQARRGIESPSRLDEDCRLVRCIHSVADESRRCAALRSQQDALIRSAAEVAEVRVVACRRFPESRTAVRCSCQQSHVLTAVPCAPPILDLLAHVAVGQHARDRHAGPRADQVQRVQPILRVVAHDSLVERHLPAGRRCHIVAVPKPSP